MARTILTYLAVLSLAAMPCMAQKKRYAPLREQILTAKTVFLAGGPPDVLDKAYGELGKWGRFQVVSDPAQADIVLDLKYAADPSGIVIESLAITDAATRETLYTDGRSPNDAPAAQIRGLLTHYSMARDMLKDLRKRIEATESARTFEYAIQLATRTAKYFADMSALHDKLAAQEHSSQADSFRDGAKFWRVRADDLAKTNSETAKFLANTTEYELLKKHNLEQIEMYRDDTLKRGCGAIEDMSNFTHLVDGARAKLTAEVGQALDAVEADEAVLKADCGSAQAIRLMKEQGEKPPSN